MVHDAVRPLVSPQTISANIALAEKHGCCITCAPLLETLVVRQGDGKFVLPNRSDAAIARAPQTFRLHELLSAHEQALANGRHDFIDSCTLMTYYGHDITLLSDSDENIKITTPIDLLVVETLLHRRQE